MGVKVQSNSRPRSAALYEYFAGRCGLALIRCDQPDDSIEHGEKTLETKSFRILKTKI